VVAYAPAFRADFIWDDDQYLTENRVIRAPDGLKRTWLDPTANPQYYPLVFTTFWIEHRLWQLQPAGYHAVNILLHAGCACLLWIILRRLDIPAAWLAAIFFALHPIQVESVAWITERKNVLSGLFFFLSLLAYLKFALPDASASRGRRRLSYAAALLLFACALLSKTVTCSLPAVILLLLAWKRPRLRASDVWPLVPFFVLGIALAGVTVWVERHHVLTKELSFGLSPVERILLAGRAVWFYFGKLLWPADLAFSYERWDISAAKWWQFFYPLALLIVLAVLVAGRRRLGVAPLVAALSYIVMLVPALGFIDVYPFRYSWVADHFQYLAAAAPIAGITALAARFLSANPPLARIVAAIFVALYGGLTYRQCGAYRDLHTLWTDTLEKNPGSWLARNNLGVLYLEQDRLDEARAQFEAAVQLNPNYALPLVNLATIELKKKNWLEAIALCERALRTTDVSRAEAHSNLGQSLVRVGRFNEALEHYRKAIARSPTYRLPRIGLADLLIGLNRMNDAEKELLELLHAEQGDNAGALAHYLEALRLHPKDAFLLTQVAKLHAALGQSDQAEETARRALDVDPSNDEAREVLFAIRHRLPTQPAPEP
jgi:tetratricopeptide (TPR) repeat protein